MNLTFNQYRAIDLTIMTALLAISEAVATIAAKEWFPYEFFSVSTTLAIVCIVMMRWDGFAVLHAAVGGCVFCLVMGAEPQQFAVYCIGNCGALAALLLFKIVGKKKIAEKFWSSVLFALAAFLGMELGRWGVSLVFPNTGSETISERLVSFIITDSVTLLFTLVAVFVSRRMDGLFEDQRSYLLRVKEEERKDREAQERERERENNWNNFENWDNWN